MHLELILETIYINFGVLGAFGVQLGRESTDLEYTL